MSVLGARLDGQGVSAVPAESRGLAYGDGLFETIAIQDGRPRLLSLHLERLREGSRRLLMSPPGETWLRDEVAALAALPGCGVVKLILFRGTGGRGYRPDPDATSHCLVLAFPVAAGTAAARPLRVRLCNLRLGIQPALAGLKHLNRLEQVLARAEWNDPEVDEGLMLDQEGYLVEATQANLFLVCNGRLLTPDLGRCGVAGVMRRLIIERLAPAVNIPVDIGMLTPAALDEASEVFLCNSLYGLRPVAEIERWHWPRAPVTAALAEALAREWDRL